ncbi:hypothetical protein CO051_01330 [Candidatus Roizmanbacteria bacterium CG_4_9_14_0_2_um_filter_39_13]|uniref:Four helix bundle protein n=1 Tax=Candidatus Roizmanbacteria bacterium CG_4_9_14_0_2_um_filter_39_13 TaxID=1974839 RepID=A0A2M8F2S5_9BACT|nr:MAG: hypothetical protein COU64_04385 [Candidatus Pacebacteria bacterium CG10_big_fil_rev_8_21_14_0_10_40_26]PIZ66758.1 MAG: hypothetical protein COY15_00175 [Candidatus Roizmanbacteria bacterium CG_4_10_14_0_2_um_filter_39_12]PJC33585.1 MAG: hypothetical protein CO051_01330 [Candidatus Roizmanbacteria bacterium CG_4_9_14_0_2_um_filter_39_13]
MYKFEKLKVWNESNRLIEMAYQLIKELPTNEKYNASDQLRR